MPTKMKLYQFMPMPSDEPQLSTSPFCIKLEAYLILTGRPYEATAGAPPFAPTKTVPYVVYQGKKIGDSQAIIDLLESETLATTLDKGTLSTEQQSTSQEVLELVEKKLYFSLIYSVAMDEDGSIRSTRSNLGCLGPALLPPKTNPGGTD